MNTLEWMDAGLCRQVDGDLFYPDVGEPTTDAKRVCHHCDVRMECLQWALDHDERHGIWGGLGPGQRQQLRTKLKGAA